MKFKIVRESILEQWLRGTKRQRKNETDDYTQSFECRWQTCFGQLKNEDDHYSIFCSIGDWNTNLTDYLTDLRFDELNLTEEPHKDILFRHYTKILLAASEILTDFQDMLSTFRAGKLLTDTELNNEKTASRQELDKKSNPGDTQRIFTFINNICKHKINNIHICNHHLKIHFADSGVASDSSNTIRINNVDLFIPKNPNTDPQKTADTIEMPPLPYIIDTIIKGYQIVDETFNADKNKFEKLCTLYKGVSVR
jgi:hypothetical protein